MARGKSLHDPLEWIQPAEERRKLSVSAPCNLPEFVTCTWPVRAIGARLAFMLSAGIALAGCSGGGEGNLTEVTGEYPVAWVERDLPRNGDALAPDDLLDVAPFRPGAGLVLKEQSSPGAPEKVLTRGLFQGRIDVRDVSASYDGRRLLFALRAPAIRDSDVQPTWNIWEYDRDTESLRRVIVPDIVAEEGEDIMPAWLPDGRIVFASTRQRTARAVSVDEGRPQYPLQEFTGTRAAFMLHVMNADGTDIRQITTGYGHDLWPTVLPDGHLLFVRYERLADGDGMHFYRVRPDGHALQPLFGLHSHEIRPGLRVEYTRPRLLDDGRVLALLRPRETQRWSVLPHAIDVDLYRERGVRTDDRPGGKAMQALVPGRFPLEDGIETVGRHADAVPLGDGTGRLFVSWSACRLRHAASGDLRPCTDELLAAPGWEEADPLYGLFIHDLAQGRRLPVTVPKEGRLMTDIAILVPRTLPGYLRDGEAGVDLDADLVEENVGVLDIGSVHDLDGVFDPLGSLQVSLADLADPLQATANDRPVRFLRLEKAVPLPSPQVRAIPGAAFGVSRANGMREILGYVPVEPDGSVRVKVPAGIVVDFTLLDGSGRRIGGRHPVAVQVMPGEVRHCAGCHLAGSGEAHGRPDAGPRALNRGAAGGAPFPNTVAERHAHAGETMAQALARTRGEERAPSMDIVFQDEWTEPTLRTPDDAFAWRYADLATPPPASDACIAAWSATCRSTIHYEQHIHPLWQRDRRELDVDGTTVLADHTCNTCHAPRDADGLVQLPAMQLDLSDGPSPQLAAHFNSYRELLATDNEQELVDGALVDRLVDLLDGNGDPVYEVDVDGNPVLDEFGDPVPVRVTVPVPPPMSVAGARASNRFFAPFAAGAAHDGWLSPAELRLLREWLDLGGQYYNDPFVAPEN